MKVIHLGKCPGFQWKCNCGKEAVVHKTFYPERDLCIHLYLCNDCAWTYEKKGRKLSSWEIQEKQKDIAKWNEWMYGK